MKKNESTIDRRASEAAQTFGSLVRSRRQALAMSQDQLALATGVGRRFLIELEAGKASCHLGRGLAVAEALGLYPVDLRHGDDEPAMLILPEIASEEEPNG